MKKEDIIRIVDEARLTCVAEMFESELDRFATLVAASEREACAKVCEVSPSFRSTLDGPSIRETIGKRIAAAIRARGNT
jgi:hypothetical protein